MKHRPCEKSKSFKNNNNSCGICVGANHSAAQGQKHEEKPAVQPISSCSQKLLIVQKYTRQSYVHSTPCANEYGRNQSAQYLYFLQIKYTSHAHAGTLLELSTHGIHQRTFWQSSEQPQHHQHLDASPKIQLLDKLAGGGRADHRHGFHAVVRL